MSVARWPSSWSADHRLQLVPPFSDLAALVGTSHATFPVAIVNNSGNMVGWAYFQLTGSAGGSTKQIRGKFVSPINVSDLSVVQDGGNGTTQFGAFTVKLIN